MLDHIGFTWRRNRVQGLYDQALAPLGSLC